MKHITKPSDLSLESVLSELSAFRQSSKSSRRIPEDIWEKAVKLCEKHKIGRVHRVLSLGYNGLKERVIRNRNPEKNSQSPHPFVELKIPNVDHSIGLPNSQYLIELSRTDGARMRIYSSKNNPLNLNTLCSTFLKN